MRGLWGHCGVVSPPRPRAHRLGVDVQGPLEVPGQVITVGHTSQPEPEPELGMDVTGALRGGDTAGTERGYGGDMKKV